MEAFQVLWSKPLIKGRHISALPSRFGSQSPGLFCFPDYCVLLAICSIFAWKSHGGGIKLYTDRAFAEKLHRAGILALWESYDVDVLESIKPSDINPNIFWNAGKLTALLAQRGPCICFDTDLIIWQGLQEDLADADVAFTHWESAQPSYWYCRRRDLHRPLGYRFRKAWNWSSGLAANTSIMYFKDDSFKNYYAEQSIRYIRGNQIGSVTRKSEMPEMLFAEQRLLSMCCEEKGIHAKAIIDAVWSPKRSWFTKHDERYGEWLFFDLSNNTPITHAWVYKRHIENDLQAREAYCKKLASRIVSEHKRGSCNQSNP